jgi:hypothetical protein
MKSEKRKSDRELLVAPTARRDLLEIWDPIAAVQTRRIV